jgi:hypothetical protein
VRDDEPPEPPEYTRTISTRWEEQLVRGCSCHACGRDGQHQPSCSVHEEPPAALRLRKVVRLVAPTARPFG